MGQGGIEIERRFLVSVRAGLWGELRQGLPFRQGYLRTGNPSVRIRTGEPRGPVLTYKEGQGIRRTEVEEVVSSDMAEALFLAAGDRTIRKVRYPLGPWELDRFLDDLEGLVVLEIELDHENAAIPDVPEGIDILHEVTAYNHLTSSALAGMSSEDRRALVRAMKT